MHAAAQGAPARRRARARAAARLRLPDRGDDRGVDDGVDVAPAGHGGAPGGGAAAPRATRCAVSARCCPPGRVLTRHRRMAVPAEAKASPAEAEVFVMEVRPAGGVGAARGRGAGAAVADGDDTAGGGERAARRGRGGSVPGEPTGEVVAARRRAPPLERLDTTRRLPPWQPFEGGGGVRPPRRGDNRPLAAGLAPVSVVAHPAADPAAAGSYTEPALASSPGVAALEEKLRAHRAKLESEREALRARRNSRTGCAVARPRRGECGGRRRRRRRAASASVIHAAASTPPPASTPTPAEPVPTPKLAVKETTPRTTRRG